MAGATVSQWLLLACGANVNMRRIMLQINTYSSIPVVPASVPAPVRERRVSVRCDEPDAGGAWARALAAEGLQVQVQPADDGATAPADALVLHVSGRLAEHLGRLRMLRGQSPQTPLMLAVRELRDLDQVLGLEMGADDAIDAALMAPVVAARLRALWRRGAPLLGTEPASQLRFGGLELQLLQRQATLDGQIVALTEGEFEVLWLLASHAGQALSRRELLKHVRGLDDHPMDRSVDCRVYRIRAKLGDMASGKQRIRTVRNHGYVFSPIGW